MICPAIPIKSVTQGASGRWGRSEGHSVSKRFKLLLALYLPIWLASIAFVAWGFIQHTPGDPPLFPGARYVWGAAFMCAGMVPYNLIMVWLYDTGRLTRKKVRLRPWVRRLLRIDEGPRDGRAGIN